MNKICANRLEGVPWNAARQWLAAWQLHSTKLTQSFFVVSLIYDTSFDYKRNSQEREKAERIQHIVISHDIVDELYI